jgi:hypothetical protein
MDCPQTSTVTVTSGNQTEQASHDAYYYNGGCYCGGAKIIAQNSTETVPQEFELTQNYPNPFNPTTTLKYAVPKNVYVTIKIYNTLGAEVATLVNEEKPAGFYELTFDGSRYASGMYFYRMTAGEFTETKKLILMK